MKLLLDQDVYAVTARLLKDLGHEVVTAADIGRSRAPDEELLTIAQEQGRLFVTRDRDFGGLVFVRGFGTGVIYLPDYSVLCVRFVLIQLSRLPPHESAFNSRGSQSTKRQ